MSNVGSRFAGRHKRASVSRAERQRARMLAMTPQPAVPFMLSSTPPAFPGEVTVPPHRGAVIEPAPADSLSDYTIQAKPKAKPAAKTGTGKAGAAKSGAGKAGSSKAGSGKSGAKKSATVKQATIPTAAERARSAAARAAQSRAAAPSPAPESAAEIGEAGTIPPAATLPQETRARADEPAGTPPVTAAAELAQAPEQPEIAAPAGIAAAEAVAQPLTATVTSPAVIPAAQPVAAPAMAAATIARPEQRALVRQERGLIARVVAWLGRLAPRKQRASLPKARTRLERPVQPVATVAPVAAAPQPMPIPDAAPPEAALPLKTESILSGRMVLKLSEENSRLRRELEALRAAAERGDNADDDSGDTGKGH